MDYGHLNAVRREFVVTGPLIPTPWAHHVGDTMHPRNLT